MYMHKYDKIAETKVKEKQLQDFVCRYKLPEKKKKKRHYEFLLRIRKINAELVDNKWFSFYIFTALLFGLILSRLIIRS